MMSQLTKLLLLGAVILILIVVLLAQGQIAPVVAYMDLHNGFFAGLGALITAIATGVIAYYTKSTRDLFTLEEKRVEGTRVHIDSWIGYLAGSLAATVGNLGLLIDVAEDTLPSRKLDQSAEASPEYTEKLIDQFRTSFRNICENTADRLLAESEGLPRLARSVSPEVVRLTTRLEMGFKSLKATASLMTHAGPDRLLELAKNYRSEAIQLHQKITSEKEVEIPESYRQDLPKEMFPE